MISAVELKMRIDSKMYRDVNLPKSSMQPEQSNTQKANDKVEGKSDQGMNVDGDRELYEVYVYLKVSREMADVLDLEEEDELYPYVVTIDLELKKILALYRNWEKADKNRRPIEHLYEFRFVPWRGAYSVASLT